MSNQYELFQEACRLNNAGAAFLANHDSGNAVKALKSSLVIMEGISQEAPGEDLTSANKPSQCLYVEIPGLEDTFFVYNRALLLDGNDASDLSFFNAIVLWNLALTFHQRGKTHCQEAKLRRAAYFYELTARLLAGVPTNNHGALVVAALNNQAQIHHELFEFERCLTLLEHVSMISEHIPTPPPKNSMEVEEEDFSSNNYFDLDHMDEIWLNITIAKAPTTAASA